MGVAIYECLGTKLPLSVEKERPEEYWRLVNVALGELSSAAEATGGYPSSTSSNLTTHHPPAASTPSQPPSQPGFYSSAPTVSSYSQGTMTSGKQPMP